MLFDLAAQHKCQTFAAIWASDNRIKIVHSLGRYVALLGKDLTDRHHNNFFGFKRVKLGGVPPPLTYFTTDMFQK